MQGSSVNAWSQSSKGYLGRKYQLIINIIVGIPNIYWHGREDTNNIMIIDFLGPNLEDLFNMCERRFSVKTVIMLGD